MHTLRGGKCIHVINQVRERVGGVYLLDLKDAFSAWFGQRKLKVICHWVWCSLNVSLPRSYRRAAGEKGGGKERDPCRLRLHRKYCRDKRGGSRPPPPFQALTHSHSPLLLSATTMLATCVSPLRALTNSLIRAKWLQTHTNMMSSKMAFIHY